MADEELGKLIRVDLLCGLRSPKGKLLRWEKALSHRKLSEPQTWFWEIQRMPPHAGIAR
jgi:hypothetical protein